MNVYREIEKGFNEYDNWRYLKSVEAISTSVYNELINSQILIGKKLTVLLGNYCLLSFPQLTIMEYLNTDFPKAEVAIVSQEAHHPPCCRSCCGAGKFDWVSSITGPSPPKSRFEFVRDKRIVLIHRKNNGEFSNGHMWAPTEVNEGERICDDCLGTGICLSECDYIDYDSPSKDSLVPCDIRYFINPNQRR